MSALFFQGSSIAALVDTTSRISINEIPNTEIGRTTVPDESRRGKGCWLYGSTIYRSNSSTETSSRRTIWWDELEGGRHTRSSGTRDFPRSSTDRRERSEYTKTADGYRLQAQKRLERPWFQSIENAEIIGTGIIRSADENQGTSSFRPVL